MIDMCNRSILIVFFCVFFTAINAQCWIVQKSESLNPGIYLKSIYFYDENYGWSGGSNGLFYYTTNAGLSWNRKDINLGSSINSIYFLDSLSGWILTSNGQIHATIDGGLSWEYLAKIDISVTPNNNLVFVSKQVGYATSSTDLYKTEDGGKTWSKVYYFTFLGKIQAINNGELWVNGNYSLIKSSDNGKTWNTVKVPTNLYFTDFYFVNNSTGWLLSNNYIYKTTDGGINWVQQNYSIFPWYHNLYFIDTLIGFISVNDSYIIKTINGGKTWFKEDLPYSVLDSRISANSISKAWICSAPTVILGYSTKPIIKIIEPTDSLCYKTKHVFRCQADYIYTDFRWYLDNFSYVRSNSDSFELPDNLTSGTHKIFILGNKKQSECVSDTLTYNFYIRDKLIASAGRDTMVCIGAPIDLEGRGGVKYNWNTGDQTQRIKFFAKSGINIYNLSVTDQNGCTATDNVLIYGKSDINKIKISMDEGYIGCRNRDSIGFNVDLNNYKFYWSGPDTFYSEVKTPMLDKAGRYNLIIQNLDDLCIYDTATYLYYNVDTAEIKITLRRDDVNGTNSGAIHIMIDKGIAPYHVTWEKDGIFYNNEVNLDNLGSGLFHCRVLSGNDCISNRFITIKNLILDVKNFSDKYELQIQRNKLIINECDGKNLYLKIYNIHGQIIKAFRELCNDKIEYSIDNFTSGYYFLNIVSSSGNYIKKFAIY